MELDQIKGFLLDMDGTFYLGETLLPGALALLDYFNQHQLPFTFLTNNSSKSSHEYIKKLTALGIQPGDARVFTSGDATAAYCQKMMPGKRVHLVGTPGLEETFRSTGFNLVEKEPELLILGYDTTLTYQKLERLCNFLVQDIPFIATHPDINCPSPVGFSPDIGSMLALIKTSTGREPDLIIGKPNRMIVDMAAARLGLQASDVAMIGDRLYTDIALGETAGVTSILVLTGETRLADLQDSRFHPDYVVKDLVELLQRLQESTSS